MPGQMSPQQARVIDPVLSNHARQYKNKDFVLAALFPEVPVSARGGKVIKFDKAAFRRYNSRRAPGADTKRIQVGYAAETFSLHQDSLEALTPREIEEESGLVDINIAAQGIEVVLDSLMLNSEYERAQIATDVNNYAASNKLALSGSDQWSDPTANVKDQVDTGREQVRKRVGHKANIAVISPAAQLALTQNDRIRDQFKYTSADSITIEMIARYLQVEKVIVPEAVSLPEGAGDDDDFEDVWGNFVLLAYVPSAIRSRHVPSFGYTYRLKNYPMVEAAYYDHRAKSDVNGVTIEERPYLTSPEAGYLLSNVV